MNRYGKSIYAILFMLLTVSINGQELHIYYNLHNDNVRYEKEGTTIEFPKIKQGDDIVLHITEFNNYLYTLELDITNEQVTDQNGTFTDASLMSNFMPSLLPTPSFGDADESGYGSATSFIDIPLLTINDSPITLSSLFGGRGSDALLKELDFTSNEISSTLMEMDAIAEQLNLYRQTIIVSELAKEYIELLKTNKNLKPSFVQSMCEDYYEAIFRKDSKESIELNDVLSMQDDASKYVSLLADFQLHSSNLNQKTSTLENLTRQFRSANVEETEAFKNYSKQLSNFLEKSKSLNAQLVNIQNSRSQYSTYPSTAQLSELQFQLAEIISNDFTYHSRLKVTGDRVNINIKVKKIDGDQNDEEAVIKSRWLSYEAKGGLKFTGSVGINFSQYFDPAQNYSANNGVIVGEDDGDFSPTITSFIHFYSYSGKKVSLGGSFGIGFPLSSSGDNQSLHFFVGPSLIFGSSQRMILNFGLSGGRVTRLARGFQVGDEFDVNLGDIPTRSPYELGLFIGASFNLGAN